MAHEPTKPAIANTTFQLGSDLSVNRLGYGAMRLTGQPGNFGRYADWEAGKHPRMSNRLGLFRLVQMPGSHEVMFSNPIGLAEKIIVAGRD